MLPLPVELFEAFRVFAEAAPAITPPTARRPWRLADAAQIAADVTWASGIFNVVADTEQNERNAALARWLSTLGSEQWLIASRQAMRYLSDQAASFNPLQSALLPLEPAAVARLNAWCVAMLKAFYADTAAKRPPGPHDTEVLPPVEAVPATPAGIPPETETEPPAESGDTSTKPSSAGRDDPQATEIPPVPAGIDGARWQVIWPLYVERVEKFRAEHKRPPKRSEDHLWYSGAGVTRPEMRALRIVWRKIFLPRRARPC